MLVFLVPMLYHVLAVAEQTASSVDWGALAQYGAIGIIATALAFFAYKQSGARDQDHKDAIAAKDAEIARLTADKKIEHERGDRLEAKLAEVNLAKDQMVEKTNDMLKALTEMVRRG